MKKCLFIASLLLALMLPGIIQADLINVTCDGVAGNLVCRDVSGNIIYTVDATNRKITIPSGSAIDVASGGYFKLAGTTVTATAAKLNMIPADGAAGTYLQTDGSGSWTWVAGTSGSLDDAYNTGATITVDSGAVQLNGSHGSNDTFFVNKTAGTGDAIQITNAGTGNDINGTGGTWSVTKDGVATFASFSPLTAGLSITGGTVNLNASSNNATNLNTGSSSGAVTIGGGSGTVAVNSSSWDISTAGAVTGLTSVGMSGDLTLSAGDVYLADGKAIKGSATTAETLKIQAYDVDNTTYRDVLTLTNGNTITAVLGSGNETISVNSADWDISTTGDMTGIGAVTMNGLLTGSLGATVTGAAVNLNASSNFDVNIGTGTSTGTVTIGGAAAQTINIGDGAAAKTVTLGSSNTTSTTTLLSGSGAVNVNVSNNQPTNINTGTSTGTTTIGNANSFVTVAGVVTGASPLVFDGNTADVNKTTIAVVDPTAARTITLPNASGTANLNCTATHDYAGGAADWTLSVAEMQCGYITVSNASGAVSAILPSAIPGKTYTVTNGSGDVLTFKVTGQTGGTIANGKWGFYTTIAADVAEVYELP